MHHALRRTACDYGTVNVIMAVKKKYCLNTTTTYHSVARQPYTTTLGDVIMSCADLIQVIILGVRLNLCICLSSVGIIS